MDEPETPGVPEQSATATEQARRAAGEVAFDALDDGVVYVYADWWLNHAHELDASAGSEAAGE